jgi:hypothetical protein
LSHQAIFAPLKGGEFTFAPVSISTPNGPATVSVSGSFSVTENRRLAFTAKRRVSFSNQAITDTAVDVVGSGKTVTDVPNSDHVLSFDLPPIRPVGSKEALPDQFSVRFRVSNGRD